MIAGSVAVAVIMYGLSGSKKVENEKDALPVASVVTVMKSRKFRPSANPSGRR